MLYYFLDGLDKKGPYSSAELKSRNVTPDTLVFSDGMSKWTAIKDIPELNTIIFDIKAESEAISESVLTHVQEKNSIQNENAEVQNKTPETKQVKKVKIPAILFLFIGILISVGLSYFIVQGQRDKDKKDIDKKIDNVFQGKDEICDYKKTGVQGTLKEVSIKTSDIFGTSAIVDGEYLATMPTIPDEDKGGKDNIWYQEELKKWNTYKDLVEYYVCNSGGFTIQTLTKKNNGFDLVESDSKNMAYKVPASRYRAGTNYGYGYTSPGYSIPTYRGSVQEAYNGAMDYLTKDKENKSYVAGSYDKIKTFDEIANDFYYIGNVEPTKYSSSSVFAKSWKSAGDAYVYNSDWIVWYGYEGWHYEILEDKKLFNKRWAIYSGIGSFVALVLYLLIRYRRRISVQVS